MDSDVLFINEIKADISGVNISENIQINDLFEVSQRQSSFTNTINLPKTEINKEIFNSLGIETNISDVPYRFQRITYLRNGIEMFSNASGIIQETSNEYKLNIYYNNNKLFEVIKDKKVSDLDLGGLNHDLTLENWAERLDGNNVIYPIADYGTQLDSVVEFDNQVPALRVSYIWNKIFSEAGFKYRYTGRGNRNDYNPFLSTEFKDSFFSLDSGLNKTDSFAPPIIGLTSNTIKSLTFEQYRFQLISFVQIYEWRLPFEIIQPITFNTISSDINTIQVGTISGVTNYTAKQSGFYTINLNGNFLGNSIQKVFLRLVSQNGILANIQEFEIGTNDVNFTQRFYLEEGQSIYFNFQILNEISNIPLEFSFDFDLQISLDNRTPSVNFSEYFNNISQTSFVKDICNYFGLAFINRGDTYDFMSYQELFTIFAKYKNFNAFDPVNYTFEDWSNKFSFSDSEKYTIGDYARRNIFAYQYDDGVSRYADSFISVSDETLEPKKTLITRIFKAPDTSIISVSNNQLVRMNLYEIDKEKVKTLKSTPYIFLPQRVQGSFQYKQSGIGIKVFTYNGFFYIAKFTGLSWNNSLNKWNSGLSNVLNFQNMITAEINLDEYDVANIDFFKLKYIKQLGGMYYLNKISNFVNDVTTKCELIKVQPSEQLGSFSDDFSDDFNN